MKIYDFDAKFYEYASGWLAMRPGITEDQVDEAYNDIMKDWLNAPAQWLGGMKPGEYFRQFTDPDALVRMLVEYDRRGIDVPELLYTRIVEIGAPCVDALARVARRSDFSYALRQTAIALMDDIGTNLPIDLFIDLLREESDDEEARELIERVGEILMKADDRVVEPLIALSADAEGYHKMVVLEVLACFPEHEEIYGLLVNAFLTEHENRAFYSTLLEKYGNPDAIEPLKKVLSMSDLTYLDYLEIRNSIESLGGDPGEERTFYGDPDYEALRNV